MKALILGNTNPHLEAALRLAGCTFEAHDPLDLILYVSEHESGYDRIYNGSQSLENPVRLKVKDFDFIVTRLSGGLEHKTVFLEHLHRNLGMYSPQTSESIKIASNKILTTLRLSQAGIKTPKTVWAKAPVHVDYIIKKMMEGLPVICKTVYGSQGAGVSILETARTANTVLESFFKSEINVKLQRYIEGGSKDIRAIVVGEKVVVAMERTANKGDFRANISKGGSGQKIELSEQDKSICVKSAKALGMEFAGVDLMKDKDGNSYVIEVNGNPGIKIIDITGHNFFVDLVKHCKSKAGTSTQAATQQQASQSATQGVPFIAEPSQPMTLEEIIEGFPSTQEARRFGLWD
ncbi:ATP-grasp domain-containing protein [Salmonirosea aquatica]|uniref:RimK family alpha-L-glutamate ligase n=1 Tax=Salmonirosea aquatica TaxID=2654236 RepID=A0A7C9BFG8_9BACT|nr:RimK family alpha-L-glutamate ligase [Cytophagaceae bacterium SJW1-29]